MYQHERTRLQTHNPCPSGEEKGVFAPPTHRKRHRSSPPEESHRATLPRKQTSRDRNEVRVTFEMLEDQMVALREEVSSIRCMLVRLLKSTAATRPN
jgi:hypothetical protein